MARLIKHTANKRGLKGNTIYNTHQIKDYNIRSAEFRVVIQGPTNIQTSEKAAAPPTVLKYYEQVLSLIKETVLL